MAAEPLRVLVLRGGPDREREVSLVSGAAVAEALREAGHQVREADIGPGRLEALDEFVAWGGDVVFPVLHGSWGEGGALQRILDQRGVAYVGCRTAAAELCMDKTRSKEALAAQGLPTPPWQRLRRGEACTLAPPVVVKPPREGSSIDVAICKDSGKLAATLADFTARHEELLVERFVAGREMTVGVIAEASQPGGLRALPPIQIIPATEFYDYEAKYHRDDTQYVFDVALPAEVIDRMERLAVSVFRALGCRHLSRVDMIVDADDQPWILEVNTMPGFTSHSLLPKAAARIGLPMPALVDRLVRLATAG